MPVPTAPHGCVAYRLCLCCALLLAAAASACTGPVERTGQASIDRSFTVDGYRWADGGLVYVFLKARESRGKVEVCAAQMPTQLPALASKFDGSAMESMIVHVGGDRVMHGLGYANVLPLVDDVAGQPANCARSTTAWKPDHAEAEIELVVPRMMFVD